MGNGNQKSDGVDAALRGARPEASDALLAALSGQVLAAPRPTSSRKHRGSRIAFALALTVFMLGTFASFGGLGYAATNSSSAGAQYGEQSVPDATPPATPPETPPSSSVGVAGQSTGPQSTGDTLPFTGYGLGGTAIIGGALLALGVFLRRREATE